MYRSTDLINGLFGLIGWRQNANTLGFKISDSLTASSTGQYFQDVHPLLTLDNVKAVAPDFKRVFPLWVAGSYVMGNIVLHSDLYYKAVVATTTEEPGVGAEWDLYDAFSVWLEEKTKASILKCFGRFWNEKMTEYSAKNILESKPLFNGAGLFTDTITNASNIVGFELVPIRANGMTVRIDKIGLQFTSTSPTSVYLFHSSKIEPVQTKDIASPSNKNITWVSLTDWVLPYISSTTDAGGSWYVAYHQDELSTSEAINKDRDWSAKPYNGLLSDYYGSDLWSKYLEVYPFSIKDETQDSENLELWDISKNQYDYTKNFGLNLQVTVLSDVTDIILQHKESFQSVIGLQMACDMLREFAYNPSFNITRQNQNISKEGILYEIDGDSASNKKSGLGHELKTAMEAVKIDATEMSRVAFQEKKKGIRYRAI